jgi:acetyl-CoA carboxylase alpha subunit
VAHRTARLNPFGRRLLIDRVLGAGWTVATAAEAQGISRATGHKLVRRYRLEGPAGLAVVEPGHPWTAVALADGLLMLHLAWPPEPAAVTT